MTTDALVPLAALPGVADAAERAREAVDRLLTHQAMRRNAAAIATEAGLRCARASAALEGVDVPLDVLRTSVPADPVVQGALRVSAELRSLVESMERAPLQALARIHLLACTGLVPTDDLGRPRAAAASDDPLGFGAAPSAAEVAPRLAMLASVLSAPTAAPGIVVAAVVHGELLALRPFVRGNGLVARAAARAVLVSRGVDPRAVSAPDVGYAQDASAYARAARSFAAGEVAPWLVFCADAVAHGALEGIAIGEAILRAG